MRRRASIASVAGDKAQRSIEFHSVEVRPCLFGEVHGGSVDLPEKEIGNARFTRRADKDVDGRKFGRVQVLIDARRVDVVVACGARRCCTDEFGSASVIEGDRDDKPRVVLSVGDGLFDGALHVHRRAGAMFVERASDPIDPRIVVVHFVDAAEQFSVKSENVSYFGPWTNPVFSGESEHSEPSDVALRGGSHDSSKGLFAGGVSGSAGKSTALGPAAIAVHDAGHMQGATGLDRWIFLGDRGIRHGDATLVSPMR